MSRKSMRKLKDQGLGFAFEPYDEMNLKKDSNLGN